MVETIADRVREILQEAVEHVSNGGTMKFDIRSLFYAVRQFFLTRFFVCPVCGGKVKLKEPPDLFICEQGHVTQGDNLKPLYPGMKFYEYNSFTQDFTRSYEKTYGKIQGMVRGPRGRYATPDEYGWRTEKDVKPDLYLMRGIGNKIVVVEKAGLFDQMIANDFDKRLDCLLMTTQGFTSEAGREALLQVQGWGLKVCILHDYDINGLLIRETLTRPTKRLDTEIDPDILVDVGLTWEIINKLMRERGLIPEPVDLTKNDVAKVEGMLGRGEISQEEFNFLLRKTTDRYDAWKRGERVGDKEILGRGYRVELNALRPSEMLEWLEQRLEALDLWKTVPTQEQLDDLLKLAYTRRLAENLLSDVKEKIGFYDVEELLSKLMGKITEKVQEALEDEEPPEYLPAPDFKERLRKRMEVYWTQLATGIAQAQANKYEKTEERIEEIASKLGQIADKLREIEDLLNEITGD